MSSVGIDLGFTNAAIAAFRQGGPRIIDNQDGKSLTRSVVYLAENGQFIVGDAAEYGYRRKDPANTVTGIMRYMGRDFEDPVIQQDIRNSPYKITSSPEGSCEVELRGRRFSPIEIAAFILESLKRDAEEFLGVPVARTVISAPAHFGYRQRDAVRLAGELAGLNVFSVLPNSIAAALKFSQNQDLFNTLVCYLDGWTFDATLMFIASHVFMEGRRDFDLHLGLNDIHQAVADWFISQVYSSQGVDLTGLQDARVNYEMKLAAELAARNLAHLEHTSIVIPGITLPDGRLFDVECELCRAELSQIVQPIMDRIVEIIKAGFQKNGQTVADIEKVFIIGEAVHLPFIRETFASLFGNQALLGGCNPLTCVAEGAAIYSSMALTPQNYIQADMCTCPSCGARNLVTRADCRNCAALLRSRNWIYGTRLPLQDELECANCGARISRSDTECRECHTVFNFFALSIPQPIGVEVEGGKMEVVLNTSTFYPTLTPVIKNFRTSYDNQIYVRLPIYEGYEELTSKNTYLGQAVTILPMMPANSEVQVQFSLDEDCILDIKFILPDYQREHQSSILWANPRKKPIPGVTVTRLTKSAKVIPDGDEELASSSLEQQIPIPPDAKQKP